MSNTQPSQPKALTKLFTTEMLIDALAGRILDLLDEVDSPTATIENQALILALMRREGPVNAMHLIRTLGGAA